MLRGISNKINIVDGQRDYARFKNPDGGIILYGNFFTVIQEFITEITNRGPQLMGQNLDGNP